MLSHSFNDISKKKCKNNIIKYYLLLCKFNIKKNILINIMKYFKAILVNVVQALFHVHNS